MGSVLPFLNIPQCPTESDGEQDGRKGHGGHVGNGLGKVDTRGFVFYQRGHDIDQA